MIQPKFNYTPLVQNTEANGVRHYDTPDGLSLPSVTTILGATSDQTGLDQWRDRIGHAEAKRITDLSANIGSCFHTHMEAHIEGLDRPIGNSYVKKHGRILADVCIKEGMINVDEVWSTEAMLYYPGLYAGSSDVIGLWKGQEAIIDFKNTRRPKQRQHIDNYFCQMCAYGAAHNKLFDTNINTGVIMMVAREHECLGEYQEFVIEGDEWNKYTDMWFDRVRMYYDIK